MRAYQDMVYSTSVRILADPAQAEDVAQNVFLKAYERFDELRENPTTPGWLKTVATNMSLNHLQRYRKRLHFVGDWRRDDDSDESEQMPEFAIEDDTLGAIADEQRTQFIERALRALPEHQRVPFELFHFEDLSYQDIAAQLGVSVPKIKTDIFRARAALARTLQPHGASLTAGLPEGLA